jgi:hypothetical protein
VSTIGARSQKWGIENYVQFRGRDEATRVTMPVSVRKLQTAERYNSSNKLGFGNSSLYWTIFATGCGWAWRPAKENENCGLVRMTAGSGEIEIRHGPIEAEQLFDLERG